MTESTRRRLMPRSIAVGALALGLVGGGYGIASAATGSSPITTASSNAAKPPAARRLHPPQVRRSPGAVSTATRRC